MQIVLTSALVLASFAKTSLPTLAQPVPAVVPEVFPKVDLPDGGILLPDPAHKQSFYYYLDSCRHPHPDFKGRLVGLYSSTDEGKTWQLLNNEFEFKIVFVHPETGELFAVVPNRVYETDKDGVLHLNSFYKAISSVDGKHWKDLMPKQPPIHDIVRISLDPDHPNRIRLFGWGFRNFYWVAVDDKYSAWKFVDIPTGPPF